MRYYGLIFQVRVVLGRTVVSSGDWPFDNLRRSRQSHHHHSDDDFHSGGHNVSHHYDNSPSHDYTQPDDQTILSQKTFTDYIFSFSIHDNQSDD